MVILYVLDISNQVLKKKIACEQAANDVVKSWHNTSWLSFWLCHFSWGNVWLRNRIDLFMGGSRL